MMTIGINFIVIFSNFCVAASFFWLNYYGISKYKYIFAKDYVRNWSEEVFFYYKRKKLFRGHTIFVILTEKKLLECFSKNNCNKQMKKSLELEK